MKTRKSIALAVATCAAACVIAVPTIAFAGGGSAAVGTAATEPAVATAGRAAEKASLAQQDATVDVAAYGLDSAAGQGAGFVDADGDGICDNWSGASGQSQGQGAGYVDANGDGVCDNWSGAAGQGQGWGHHGCGAGCAYVDADGDGVCDNWNGAGAGAGWGHHGGGHHGRGC